MDKCTLKFLEYNIDDFIIGTSDICLETSDIPPGNYSLLHLDRGNNEKINHLKVDYPYHAHNILYRKQK